MRQMHADLVGAAGEQLAFEQRAMGRQAGCSAKVQALQAREPGGGTLPLGIHPHPALPRRRQVTQQRNCTSTGRGAPSSP